MQSRERLDRLRLLKDQQVQVLVCGGIEAHYEQMVEASGIEVVSWVSGNVEEILKSIVADPHGFENKAGPGAARRQAVVGYGDGV
jgi:predicted Fe-Mo cluster-binding NifX family protein